MENIKVILSKKFSLQGRDWVRGLIIAGLTSGLVVIQTSLDAGDIVFNWKQIGMAAIAGGVGYLLKNGLLEPSKVITEVPTQQAEKVTQEIKDTV